MTFTTATSLELERGTQPATDGSCGLGSTSANTTDQTRWLPEKGHL